jgi:hypothetical protein
LDGEELGCLLARERIRAVQVFAASNTPYSQYRPYISQYLTSSSGPARLAIIFTSAIYCARPKQRLVLFAPLLPLRIVLTSAVQEASLKLSAH